MKAYFDHIATTPLHPEVYEEMVPFLTTHFGNPQSLHEFGEPAREALMKARERVASLIKAIQMKSTSPQAGLKLITLLLRVWLKQGRGKVITSWLQVLSIFLFSTLCALWKKKALKSPTFLWINMELSIPTR